jgi:broad specificity phosphatase PhoE
MYAGQLEEVVKPLVEFFVKHPNTQVPYGESFTTYISRLFYTISKVEDYSIRHPEKCLLVVTHGSCIEYCINRLEGIPPGTKQLSGFPPAGLYDMMFNGTRWVGKEHK